MDVAIATTNALWLDGIPPVFHINVENTSLTPAFLLVSTTIRAFAN